MMTEDDEFPPEEEFQDAENMCVDWDWLGCGDPYCSICGEYYDEEDVEDDNA